jgi:hypothetical protein
VQDFVKKLILYPLANAADLRLIRRVDRTLFEQHELCVGAFRSGKDYY